MANRVLRMIGSVAGVAALVAWIGMAGASPAAARTASAGGASPLPPDQAAACGAPAVGFAACHAIQLLHPSANWHPGPTKKPGGGGGGGGSGPSLPSSGYYPGDLQGAYGLTSDSAAYGAGETVAIVDAYDDPNAASDLSYYRTNLNGAKDGNTGLTDGTIPSLCSTGQTPNGNNPPNCVNFTKINQSGGTSYPRSNTGWSEEISLDLDMVSAICPNCNIVLVEASSNSFSNLQAAVSEAKKFSPTPIAISNSYGGSEFSGEATYNSVYSSGPSGGPSTAAPAMTVSSGDGGYGVEFPAAAPNVTAVGGTSLTYSVTSKSSTGAVMGVSWNPQTVWGSAGSGCSAYEPMPSWQDTSDYRISSICPAEPTSGRQVADTSFDADPNTGVAVYDSFHESGWMVFGGTSVASPSIASIYALGYGADSALGTTFNPSPAELYSAPAGSLVVVGSGSNGSCGDYLCNAGNSTADGPNYLPSGYNGPTGLGTPDGVGAF